MPYNNLIYLLVVIIILATRGIPDEPAFSGPVTFLLLAGKTLLFAALCHYYFRRPGPFQASAYFSLEKRLSILAVFNFALDVYLLDIKFYFASLPGSTLLPTLVPYAGVALFLCYLVLVWNRSRPAYNLIFGGNHSGQAFLLSNLKLNLVILLPWLLITFVADLLRLTPLEPVKRLLTSAWGEPLLILTFFLLLLLVFPWLATRLWGCQPLPDGPLRRRLEEFCRHHRVGFREIMLWPLFEGRLLTAGVMGLSRHFRYLLITPGLLQTVNQEELEAVVAHEIGHVRHRHLPLYLLFFLGFALLAHLASLPMLAVLLNSELLGGLMAVSGQTAGAIISLLGTVTLLTLVIVYFRFIFGFFMRNFERQADLYALSAMGHAAPLIRVFEKIAGPDGRIRDLPSWHHFSLGQRIDFLAACDDNPRLIKQHHRKVGRAMGLFLLLLLGLLLAFWQLPGEQAEEQARLRLAEIIIKEEIRREPENPVWRQHLGDLRYFQGEYRAAIGAYEEALGLAPEHPDVLNNLAWLLLTAEDTAVHDYPRALELALQAAALAPQAHILDTLAMAWWRNGERDKAVAAAKAALAASDNGRYYRQQLEKFRRQAPPQPPEPKP
ncbi:M48 family metallopeptidase [Desulfurivibrio alkaliphilus]|uniref:Peptidase M48 Ste24p n=1 Tax=Desulfurivibrio alkaliphilus (strain DSM 19089 / UNIQEM U267 / AHT2) TaxID=589865 RepID=D6Z565_DESAT|nr:M48 family metallopeptidase [Desulfurivibrio alkaliphilus]ADH84722.1 peptidase M48 Ste24p [Desulfurivibrio alkaliphilus AHT 2]